MPHDHGIPWGNPRFDGFFPQHFAARFKTPNLVIHNELVFRVSVAQGIPSQWLYFADEGHWVLKPQNSVLWNETVFDRLALSLY